MEATTEAELVEAVRGADAAGEPVLVLAGGSNVVIADAGFDGTVVRVATRGRRAAPSAGGRERLTRRRRRAVGRRRRRRRRRRPRRASSASAGSPGSTGATPIQNVGAYGQEVATTIASVRVLDRAQRRGRRARAADVRLRLPLERVQALRAGHVVLAVTFELAALGELGAAALRASSRARSASSEGAGAPLAEVRDAVLALRRGKGMVLDAADHDTWSAGSFFTNPILDAAAFAALERAQRGRDAPPRFPEPDGRMKTSAAWLIERAGFAAATRAARSRSRPSTRSR